jgi:hypothetical protein
VGQWRDGLCDCFKHGVCHNHLWLSYCCCLSKCTRVYYFDTCNVPMCVWIPSGAWLVRASAASSL